MNKNIIIGIVALALIIGSIVLISNKKEVQQTQSPSSSMQGMDTSMPGMDHGSMNMTQ